MDRSRSKTQPRAGVGALTKSFCSMIWSKGRERGSRQVSFKTSCQCHPSGCGRLRGEIEQPASYKGLDQPRVEDWSECAGPWRSLLKETSCRGLDRRRRSRGGSCNARHPRWVVEHLRNETQQDRIDRCHRGDTTAQVTHQQPPVGSVWNRWHNN